jgi:hypothetical protein
MFTVTLFSVKISYNPHYLVTSRSLNDECFVIYVRKIYTKRLLKRFRRSNKFIENGIKYYVWHVDTRRRFNAKRVWEKDEKSIEYAKHYKLKFIAIWCDVVQRN